MQVINKALLNFYDYLKSGLFSTLLLNVTDDSSFLLKIVYNPLYIKDEYHEIERRTSQFSILIFHVKSMMFKTDVKPQEA